MPVHSVPVAPHVSEQSVGKREERRKYCSEIKKLTKNSQNPASPFKAQAKAASVLDPAAVLDQIVLFFFSIFFLLPTHPPVGVAGR